MSDPTPKPTQTLLIAFDMKDLEVTVHYETAQAVIEGLMKDEDAIRFKAINGDWYAVDYKRVMYVKAKPFVVTNSPQ